MKSPGTNSPPSSTKKQRSASPSYATPKSASSSRVLRDDELAVLGQERIRLVVRERPVGLEVAADDVEHRQPVEHRRQHRARHAVRRVDHDAQRLQRRDVDEREHAVDEPIPDVLLARSRRASPRAIRPRPRGRARRAGPTRRRPAARRARTIFMPVYSFGLCEAVTVIAAVQPELADREIDHLGADEPEVEHVGAAVGRAFAHRRRHRRRRERACRARPRSAPARTARRRRARSRSAPSSSISLG